MLDYEPLPLSSEDVYPNLCCHLLLTPSHCHTFTPSRSGPMMALCLAREDAVEEWRKQLGPTEVEAAKQEAPESYAWQFFFHDSLCRSL